MGGTFPDYAALCREADKWARTAGKGATGGQVAAVWLNESLTVPECPARVSFEKAVYKAKLHDWKHGEFGWHGTKSIQAVADICWTNWDPSRRSGQMFGPGEYFSRGTLAGLHYSEQYAGGD